MNLYMRIRPTIVYNKNLLKSTKIKKIYLDKIIINFLNKILRKIIDIRLILC